MIEKLLEEIDTSLFNGDKYFYNGQPVPRVTSILSDMLHEDYLMTWANSIGLYQKIKYSDSMNKSSSIGTFSHDLIDDYINYQSYDLDKFKIRDYSIIKCVTNAVESFKLWYHQVFDNNIVDVLGIEEPLVTQYFAGTYDALFRINDKNILIDFKTSNHIGYKYTLQIAAYKEMIENIKGIKLDGAIILQLDKKRPNFTEYYLDFNDPIKLQFINDCRECFFSLVYAFYNRINIEKQFKEIFGGR